MDLTIVLIHTYIRISLLKREQPFYSGHNGWSKCVPYKEVLLYYSILMKVLII